MYLIVYLNSVPEGVARYAFNILCACFDDGACTCPATTPAYCMWCYCTLWHESHVYVLRTCLEVHRVGQAEKYGWNAVDFPHVIIDVRCLGYHRYSARRSCCALLSL